MAKNTNNDESTPPSWERLVKSINLTPWSVVCIVSALRRSATAHSDSNRSVAENQIANYETALANLLAAIDCDNGVVVSPAPSNMGGNQ